MYWCIVAVEHCCISCIGALVVVSIGACLLFGHSNNNLNLVKYVVSRLLVVTLLEDVCYSFRVFLDFFW